MTKNKKQKQKQKQKQSQVQNVVVNVGYKRRSSNKEKSQQQSVVSKQAIPQQQALPYLGLQSANNAQLLNSLQATLTALYGQHNKQQQLLTAPPLPATQGFQRPKMVPPSEAPPTLLPPPPPTTPKRNGTLSQKPASQGMSVASPPPQTSYNATQKSVTFSNAPPTSTPIAETVATRRNWTKSDFDLDTNKDGTVRKKGDKWRMLTEEQKQDIKDEELRNRPVRATRIKGQPNDFVTDDEAMDENRAVVALSKYKPFSSTSMPSEPPAQRPQKSVLDFFSPPAFRHSKIAPTEVASEPVRKPPADNAMLKQRFKSGRILSTGDETDTDYGNNISETLFE